MWYQVSYFHALFPNKGNLIFKGLRKYAFGSISEPILFIVQEGNYPCNAAAPLTISVNSVVMAACLALL